MSGNTPGTSPAGPGRKLDKFKWSEVLRDTPGLKHTSKSVGWCMLTWVNSKTGQAWPSQSTIAEKLGLSERTVRRAQDDLIEAGFFRVAVEGGNTGKRSGSNIYQFTIPQPRTPTSGVNEVTPDTHVQGSDDVTPDTSVTNLGHPRPVTPDTHVPLTGNGPKKEQGTSRDHRSAEPSPSVLREDDTGHGDSREHAPHVPEVDVFSFKDEKNLGVRIPCEEPGCESGYTFPTFYDAEQSDFTCPRCRAGYAGAAA